MLIPQKFHPFITFHILNKTITNLNNLNKTLSTITILPQNHKKPPLFKFKTQVIDRKNVSNYFLAVLPYQPRFWGRNVP